MELQTKVLTFSLWEQGIRCTNPLHLAWRDGEDAIGTTRYVGVYVGEMAKRYQLITGNFWNSMNNPRYKVLLTIFPLEMIKRDLD